MTDADPATAGPPPNAPSRPQLGAQKGAPPGAQTGAQPGVQPGAQPVPHPSAVQPSSVPAGTPPPPRQTPVEAFISSQSEPVRSLLWLCRDYLHRTAPGVSEAIKWGVPTFMMERNLFYLNPKGDHVVLGFVAGAQMVEFRGVFDHVAAEVAHVQVRAAADLERPGLREAVRAAAGFASEERDFGEALQSKAVLAGKAPTRGDDGDRLLA
jgi:hypothetical protein